MRRLVCLPLLLSLCAGAAQAQYRESVTSPTTDYAFTPHDAPRTVTGSVGYPGGQSTITFVSTPAPSVRAQAQGPTVGREVAAGQLDYNFYYSGPKSSYVPINFTGLFSLQVGMAYLDVAEVSVSLGSMALDRTGYETASMGLSCTQACGFGSAPTASNLSRIQVAYVAGVPGDILATYGAAGSFFGRLMAATDADGHGQGSVTLNAMASASNSRLSSAFIDPMFSIDPGYLASNPGATLTLPDGVGNAITAVPEPQTVALLLAGLAGLGMLARRRRAG